MVCTVRYGSVTVMSTPGNSVGMRDGYCRLMSARTLGDSHEILAAPEVRGERRVSRHTVRGEFLEALTLVSGVEMGSQRLEETSKSRWSGVVNLEV